MINPHSFAVSVPYSKFRLGVEWQKKSQKSSDHAGNILLTGDERAQEAEQRIQVAQQQAAQAEQRAQEAEQKAQRLAEQLRDLGVDPDTLG